MSRPTVPSKSLESQGLERVVDVALTLGVLKAVSIAGKQVVKIGEKYFAKLDDGSVVAVDAKNIDKIAPAKRDSDTVVLGKTQDPNYADVAAENGYRNFDIPAEIWANMSKTKQWEANQKFLDRAISKGDNIVLSHNPNDPTVYTGYFKQEVEYLKSKGYSVSSDGKSMIPPNH